MRMLGRGSPVRGPLLLGAILLAVAACGGNGTTAVAPPAPASAPGVSDDGSQPSGEGESAPEAAPQSPPAAGATSPEADPPPPAELESPAAGGRVNADLADTLPTVSTMASSDAPLPAAGTSSEAGGAPEGIEGVTVVPVTGSEHVRYDVEYPTSPPAGGPHLGIWLNCGFYIVPVLDELAVHSLEHGVVWVTYRSDVGAATLGELQALAVQSSHILVSPYEDQTSPLVLSAWARQLHLDSIEDPRFDQFLDVYLFDGPTAPEPGAACSGAVGVPPEHPEAIPQQG